MVHCRNSSNLDHIRTGVGNRFFHRPGYFFVCEQNEALAGDLEGLGLVEAPYGVSCHHRCALSIVARMKLFKFDQADFGQG